MYVSQNPCCSVARTVCTMNYGCLFLLACGFVVRDGHQNQEFSVCLSKALLKCSKGCLDHEIDNNQVLNVCFSKSLLQCGEDHRHHEKDN